MSEAPREGTPAAALIHALTRSKGEPITETRAAEITGLRVAAVSQSMFDSVVGGWLTRRRNLAGSIVYGPGPKLCERLGIAPLTPPAPPPPAPALAPKPSTVERAGDALASARQAIDAAKDDVARSPGWLRGLATPPAPAPARAAPAAPAKAPQVLRTPAPPAAPAVRDPIDGAHVRTRATIATTSGDPQPLKAAEGQRFNVAAAPKKPRRAGPPLPELDAASIPIIRRGPVDGRQSPKDGKWQALFDRLAAEPITGDGFPTMELPAAYAKTLQSFGYKVMKARPDGPKFKVSELGAKCILQRVG